MATLRYNHRYSHCTGEKCELKEDCLRFLAWKEAMEKGLKNIEIQDHCEDVNLDYVRVRIEKDIPN